MLRSRWSVLAAAFLGMIVGPGPILVFAMAVLLKPVTDDLGISRALLASMTLVGLPLSLITGPTVGWLIDRFGARRIMVPGVLLFAIGISGYSLLAASPFIIYSLAIFGNVSSAGASPVAFSIVIARWFDDIRGLALGIALAGIGIGVAVVPQYAAYLVAHYGWRNAYLGLALAIVVAAWIPVVLFIHEPPAFTRAAEAPGGITVQLPGMTAREAFRHWRWQLMTIAFFLGGFGINGTLAHVVALLADRGIPLQVAATSLAYTGIALIFGRVISGWCLDRFNGPVIAVICYAVPIIGILMLASGLGGAVPLVGAALCGFGIGAEVDLMAFFLSRYLGMRAYGVIYGVSFACFNLGNGVGALVGGLSFDHFHTYTPAFVAFAAALLIASALFLTLGSYAYPARRQSGAPGAPQKATAS